MDDVDEHKFYGDSTILEPIVEQQDDERTTSPMSSSSVDTGFLEEERRAYEEIKQFEQLEKQFASDRHGVRVKFDDEQLSPSVRTTVIKTEPCFQVNSTEDQVTKHFYQNEVQLKDDEKDQIYKQNLSKTPSERDSLEEEYIVTFQGEKDMLFKTNDDNIGAAYSRTPDMLDQVPLISPGKSILKKSQKKGKMSTSTSDQASIPSLSSPSSTTNKKKKSFIRSDSNDIQHLAEATAKQTLSQTFPPLRSLFEPTINIFDSTISSQMGSNTLRRSRLQYYVKPYRGDTYIHPQDSNKNRSRSLSEQRLGQQAGPTVWHTFSNQYNRLPHGPLNKRQHVSWSPVREYIHQGRDKTVKSSGKKKESSSNKTSSLASTNSTSNPCLRSSSSMIPISVRYRASRLSTLPSHFRRSFPPLSMDSYETSSTENCSLTPLTPISQINSLEQKKEKMFISSLPDIVHQHKKEHDDTMQKYDRLLEKMRATDEQLQTLSRSWINNTTKKFSARPKRALDISSNTPTKDNQFFSATTLQMGLIMLVIFNLLFIYFFNKINMWWNQSTTHPTINGQRSEGTFKF